MSTPLRVVSLLTFVLVLGACASAGKHGRGVPPEVRAQQRWDAILAGEFERAWEYLSPGARSRGTAEGYAAQMKVRPVRWTSAKVKGVECPEAELCQVTVEVGFDAPVNNPRVRRLGATSAVVEKWVFLDGTWYFVPREIGLSR